MQSDARLSEQLHHYVEIDFPDNARQKLGRILRSATLRAALDPDAKTHGMPLCDLPAEGPMQGVNGGKEGAKKPIDVLRSSKYSLLEADVRAIHPSTSKAEYIDPVQLFGTTSSRLDTQLPTLVLFECVLAYIEPDRADQLLRILSQTFEELHAVVYDIALAGETQHKPGHGGSSTTSYAPPTRFGSVMLQNLEVRLHNLPINPASQDAGWCPLTNLHSSVSHCTRCRCASCRCRAREPTRRPAHSASGSSSTGSAQPFHAGLLRRLAAASSRSGLRSTPSKSHGTCILPLSLCLAESSRS